MTSPPTADRIRTEVTALLQRLIACDTSNPPGRETQAVAVLEDYLRPTGLELERVVKDPARANLLVRLRGTGDPGTSPCPARATTRFTSSAACSSDCARTSRR